MTFDNDDKQPLDTASNSVGPGTSSLPSSLLPHLYTRPTTSRASRDSGTRTTLLSTNDGDDEAENDNEDQVKLKSDIGSGSDVKPSRRFMTAPVASALNYHPPSPSSSTLPFPSQQQQPRSHYSNGEPIATSSSGGTVSGSNASLPRTDTRQAPIRSDPAYYATASGSGFNYGQSGSYPSHPMAPSSRRLSSGRVGSGIEANAGIGYHQSVSYPPTSLSVSGMSGSPISPDSPYYQTYSDPTTSQSSGSHRPHYLPNAALPHGREWSHSSTSSMPENQISLSDVPFEACQHAVVHDRTRKRSSEDEGRPPSSSSGTTTTGIGDNTVDPEPNSKRKQKADIACDFCRGRKLRCDTKRPQCSNCASRENQVCHYKEFQRRRGPGKANKGSKVAAKPRKTSSSAATERQEVSDEHLDEVAQKRGLHTHHPPTAERETVAYTSFQHPNSGTETYFRGQNESFYTDRVAPPIRQASIFGHAQLPPLYPEQQPQYHQEFPPLPYPTASSSNRWQSSNSQPDVTVKHEPQVPIWEPPLPLHPYPPTPVDMKHETPEDDRHQARERFDARYDPYAHRGSAYPVFDEQYGSDDPRHMSSEAQVYRPVHRDSQGQFPSSASSRYGVYHSNRSGVGSHLMSNRIERHRSSSPPGEGVSLNASDVL
ncbi:hypothetical protein E1B28_005812 [Marasmius oreades]|uniref:Zn(2)-C6 fungal-type domain-containing protein n=1 Tax=Marasmius oreades TaxID=181124 RepID=A0A9P7S4G1_9AGAR|nr:uncharacterized protein E1B28_005812 [Marasmius oreades]KAG7095018.1 hypothetical protein E1B28_005812 [Marasmius oreades]